MAFNFRWCCKLLKMNKDKVIKALQKRIIEFEGEVEESVHDINVMTNQNPLTAEKIVSIAKSIEIFLQKIDTLKSAINCL